MTRSMYNARTVIYDGYKFQSMAECERYQELRLLERAGEITGLKVHPRYELQPAFTRNGKRILPIHYTGDFEYHEQGLTVVEDVKGKPRGRNSKGTRTRDFELRVKLFQYRYPTIDFRIVEK